LDDKKALRTKLRAARRSFVNDAIPQSQRGLLFRRPPNPIVAMIPEGAIIAAYFEMPSEAPATYYARWFHERGHRIALPWFSGRTAPMQFREWENPFAEDLGASPFDDGTGNALQPPADAQLLVPDVVFCPLVGFTAQGERLGQGGGHYDRFLAEHPPRLAIGLAWDCQLVDSLPTEPHDRPLDAVITPTRLYGPF
jgi:5-formyltetrahydrofolate cyclo-ligase